MDEIGDSTKEAVMDMVGCISSEATCLVFRYDAEQLKRKPTTRTKVARDGDIAGGDTLQNEYMLRIFVAQWSLAVLFTIQCVV